MDKGEKRNPEAALFTSWKAGVFCSCRTVQLLAWGTIAIPKPLPKVHSKLPVRIAVIHVREIKCPLHHKILDVIYQRNWRKKISTNTEECRKRREA
jgi:hypothetical protein